MRNPDSWPSNNNDADGERAVAQAAAAIVRNNYGQPLTGVESSAAASATNADLAARKTIRGTVRAGRPYDALTSKTTRRSGRNDECTAPGTRPNFAARKDLSVQ